MTPTLTGIGFFLFSLGFAFCGIRFYQAFQKIGGSRANKKIGVLLSAWFLNGAISHGILAVASLFFMQHHAIIFASLLTVHVILTISSICAIYLLFYIFFPSTQPLPALIIISIIGIIVISLTIITNPHPFIDASGGIDWNMSHTLGASLFFLVFPMILSQILIFARSLFLENSRQIKVVSLTMILHAFIGLINMAVRFLISYGNPDPWRTRIFDIALITMGITFIFTFLLLPTFAAYLEKRKYAYSKN